MDTLLTYPRVRSVRPLSGKRLLVAFATGEERFYDCGPLLAESAFAALADETVFQQVRADPQGYGVVWNDEIDLAESELWINGTSAEPNAPANAG
jgi:hypothetical protein